MAMDRCMLIGVEDASPAMEALWTNLLDAVEMLDASLADPAFADQVAARRSWLRGRALLVCAEPTDGSEGARRKCAAMVLLAQFDDGTGHLAIAMAESAVQADLDRLGLGLDQLMGDGAVH